MPTTPTTAAPSSTHLPRTAAPTAAATPVAVVVCAYTPARLHLLLEAVREARAQADGTDDEVVLVVDHCEELLAAATAAVPPGVLVVENAGPRGLSGARNTGARATTADTLVYLDDDALPRAGWLAALRERLLDPAVAVVGGAVHPRWEGGGAPSWFPAEYGWVVGCDYRGMAGDGAPIRNPIGACMAVRRAALEAAGGFSTELGRVGTLPVGCEETLMGIRVRQELPDAVVLRDARFAVDHLVPAARQQVGYFLRRCFHEGRSKAVVARTVGVGTGLSVEAAYVTRTLSAAVLRAALAAVRGDAGAPARAALLVLGLALTVVGVLTAPRAPAPRPAGGADPLAEDELVTVVVCTLGRDPRLVGTALAVLDQSHPHLELVVVDNDPASGRVDQLLSPITDPRLRIVAQPVRGLSAARNAGLDATTGALVAFTDDDAVPDPTWVQELLAVLHRDAAAAVTCVTGRVLAAEITTAEQGWFEESGVFDKGGAAAVWTAASTGSSAHAGLEGLGAPGVRSAFFPYTAGEMGSGNNMLFRTAALRDLGGFDEALGAGSLAKGGEDLDIFRRVILGGGVLVYTPDAVVRHFHRESYAALREQMHGYGVGMSAVLTKLVLGGGRPALGVLRCVPRGLHTLLAPGSSKNAKKPAEMPRELIWVELLGYLVGPYLYVRSTLEARHRRAVPITTWWAGARR